MEAQLCFRMVFKRGDVVGWLLIVHATWNMSLTDRSASTLKLQIKLSISPGHSMLTAPSADRLVVLAVKASASRAKDPGFESRLHRDFFGVESYQ